MDLLKFLSLLESDGLFFCRSDLLGDPFEGSITRFHFEKSKRDLETAPEEQKHIIRHNIQILRNFRFHARQNLFVNCWHLSTFESMAMWKIYAPAGQGICVSTSYENLVKLLPNDCLIGAVRYLEFESDDLTDINVLSPIMTKRNNFEYEREIRAVIWTKSIDSTHRLEENSSSPPGILVPIFYRDLIEGIFISPDMQNWAVDSIMKVCERYGLRERVRTSTINKDPHF